MTLTEAEKNIKKKKALFVLETNSLEDINNLEGRITYVSNSRDSFPELLKEYHKEKRNNHQAVVIGSYEDGGAIGVQYRV